MIDKNPRIPNFSGMGNINFKNHLANALSMGRSIIADKTPTDKGGAFGASKVRSDDIAPKRRKDKKAVSIMRRHELTTKTFRSRF